jgi:hypothetical protein
MKSLYESLGLWLIEKFCVSLREACSGVSLAKKGLQFKKSDFGRSKIVNRFAIFPSEKFNWASHDGKGHFMIPGVQLMTETDQS